MKLDLVLHRVSFWSFRKFAPRDLLGSKRCEFSPFHWPTRLDWGVEFEMQILGRTTINLRKPRIVWAEVLLHDKESVVSDK